MPQPTAVRGLRRIELITTDPEGAALFHQDLLGWRVWDSVAGGFECWIGQRHCASLRPATHGVRPGWYVVFAGARHDGDRGGAPGGAPRGGGGGGGPPRAAAPGARPADGVMDSRAAVKTAITP
ncbi:hypothetical protein LCD31_22445, partial [Saccharopolyspora sp. 6M]|nr:hypothetical protein [Saccharopolyspora sp. 6M]